MIATGLLLPWVVIVACEAYYGSSSEISRFPHQLFEPGYKYFTVGLMNAVPFIPAAILGQWAANRRRNGVADAHSMAAAMVVVGEFALSLWGQISVWRSTFSPTAHSSTAAIGLYVLVILGLVLIPVAYLVGWIIGKIAFRGAQSHGN